MSRLAARPLDLLRRVLQRLLPAGTAASVLLLEGKQTGTRGVLLQSMGQVQGSEGREENLAAETIVPALHSKVLKVNYARLQGGMLVGPLVLVHGSGAAHAIVGHLVLQL